MTTLWRTFGGEDYKFHYGAQHKADAQRVAQRLRSKGWSARVVKGGGRSEYRWVVYRRTVGPN